MNTGEVKTEGTMFKHFNGGISFIQKLQTFTETLVKRPKLFLKTNNVCVNQYKAENQRLQTEDNQKRKIKPLWLLDLKKYEQKKRQHHRACPIPTPSSYRFEI